MDNGNGKGSRYHINLEFVHPIFSEVKVRINLFGDSFATLSDEADTIVSWVHAGKNPQEGVTGTKEKETAIRPSTPAPIPTPQPAGKVACPSCRSTEVQLIRWTKNGEEKQAWKCQVCNKWLK